MVLNITVSNYNTLFVSIVMKKDQENRLTLEFLTSLSTDSYDLDLSVVFHTSEKYERTQQGNLLG